MYYLGVNCNFNGPTHENSVCLFKDGNYIDFIEEERLSKNKHSLCELPTRAINELLRRNNLSIKDIDYSNVSPQDFEKYFCIGEKYPTLIKIGNHHYHHALDSFYKSGYENGAVIIIDSSDNNEYCITLAEISKNGYNEIKRFSSLYSLGDLYTEATLYADLGGNAEGKFMGLSSYGNDLGVRFIKFSPKDCRLFFNFKLKNNPIMASKYEIFKDEFGKIFPYSSRKNNNIDIIQYKDFAATIQANYEEVLLGLVNYLYEKTIYKENLILGGGCIQNINGNDLICRKSKFKNIYCSSTPHDSGAAFGICCDMVIKNGGCINNISYDEKIFSKKTYTQEDYKRASYFLNFNKVDINVIINLIKDNKILAWFQGGSEFGPRALGHRSIVCLPNEKIMGTIVNNIKHRENWRPLAPIIPEELFENVIETNGNLSLYEHMLRKSYIKDGYKQLLKAVCHIDGSTRPQILKKEYNPKLYNVIMELYKQTGIPALINTSFNNAGMPIVETPNDAMMYFTHSNIDVMVWDGEYITRK